MRHERNFPDRHACAREQRRTRAKIGIRGPRATTCDTNEIFADRHACAREQRRTRAKIGA